MSFVPQQPGAVGWTVYGPGCRTSIYSSMAEAQRAAVRMHTVCVCNDLGMTHILPEQADVLWRALARQGLAAVRVRVNAAGWCEQIGTVGSAA